MSGQKAPSLNCGRSRAHSKMVELLRRDWGAAVVGASRSFNAAIGCALFAIGLLSGPTVNAQSVSPNEWARDVFGVTIRDQKVTSDEDWSDLAALSYARQARSAPAPVAWAPQPMPAVDGINAKIDGYGGGGNHSNGFYGSGASVSVPLAQQWGLQLDGDGGSEKGIGAYGGVGHLFWRDPSIGLLGAYGSYSHTGMGSTGLAPSARTPVDTVRRASIT
jgi:hypothetical protein